MGPSCDRTGCPWRRPAARTEWWASRVIITLALSALLSSIGWAAVRLVDHSERLSRVEQAIVDISANLRWLRDHWPELR